MSQDSKEDRRLKLPKKVRKQAKKALKAGRRARLCATSPRRRWRRGEPAPGARPAKRKDADDA